MMRLVIMGVVVFALSLGGTTGALVMTARKAHPAPSDSTTIHGDSAAARPDTAAARPDSTGRAVPADSASAGSGDSMVPSGRAGTPESTATSVLAARPGKAPSDRPAPAAGVDGHEGPGDAAFKQLARIFSNMKTTDAAKVLAYMSDDEVQGVLQQLGVRPAAGLLAALPKERAALLGRRMLNNSGKRAP